MYLREYESTDCSEMLVLFYETVRAIDRKSYTKEQLAAWAPDQTDAAAWDRTWLDHYTLVAVENDHIIGFGDIDESGYLDHLYVHPRSQNRGVATMLCDVLERRYFPKTIVTHASIPAKPFFLRRGYRLVREQQVIRNHIPLTNYVMEKIME